MMNVDEARLSMQTFHLQGARRVPAFLDLDQAGSGTLARVSEESGLVNRGWVDAPSVAPVQQRPAMSPSPQRASSGVHDRRRSSSSRGSRPHTPAVWLRRCRGDRLSSIALLRDLGVVRFRMPENRRQVRQTVLRLRPMVGDAMFGFELGTGTHTFVLATAPYLVAAAVLVFGDGIAPGLATGVGFGLGRGLVVVDRRLRRS